MNLLKEKPRQCVIIGGGFSLKENLPHLWDKLTNRFTIGLNISYKYFNSTMTMFVDIDKFYTTNYEEVKLLPLVIGQYSDNIEKMAKEAGNTYLFPCTNKYYRDPRNKVYTGCLVGLFALTMAIWLLDVGEIFLIGFDFGCQTAKLGEESCNGMALEDVTDKEVKTKNKNILIRNHKRYRTVTHFYQGDEKGEHTGISKVNFYYEKDKARKKFEPYTREQFVKIYNVGLNSRIPDDVIHKISYKEFYSKLDNKKYCQDYIRNYTKERIINELKHIKK